MEIKEKEKSVVMLMIKIYCKKHHKEIGNVKNEEGLCINCEKLKNYAFERIEKCPKGMEKGFCNNCKIHCYSNEYRNEIKNVMIFSGKWMIIFHPVIAIKHLILSIWEKMKNKSERQ